MVDAVDGSCFGLGHQRPFRDGVIAREGWFERLAVIFDEEKEQAGFRIGPSIGNDAERYRRTLSNRGRERERGHLLTYPTVRSVEDGERAPEHDRAYEVVAGHRRFDTARKAGLDTIAVRVADLDAWEAVERFIDDHVPIQSGDERHMYGQEEIDRMLARLREDWADDRLREVGPLTPYLEEKLASTRREAMRQGLLADGRVGR